nr:SPOR domain-containing protein [uncultured Flavobacterium sp.]
MKNLRNLFVCFITILTFLFIQKTSAQSTQFNLSQDHSFEKLLDQKKLFNNNFSIYKNFSIQLYYGDKSESEKKFNEFKNNHPNIDATIIYSEPKYKLIVGNYRNKIDAERNLINLRRFYPEAFIVRLTK